MLVVSLIAAFTLPIFTVEKVYGAEDNAEIVICEDGKEYGYGKDSKRNTLIIVIDKMGNILEINDNGKLCEIEKGKVVKVRKFISSKRKSKKEPKIGMRYEELLNQKYKKGKTVIVKLEIGTFVRNVNSDGQKKKRSETTEVDPCENSPESFYRFDVSENKIKFESLPVFTGQVIQTPGQKEGVPAAKEGEIQQPIKIIKVRTLLGEKILSEVGVRYNIAVTKYKEDIDRIKRDKEKGIVIFERGFETYARYYLGMYVGFLFPFHNSTDYNLLYEKPDAARPVIIEGESYKPRMLIYSSFYPFGYEPERPIFGRKMLHRIHIDIGTELSNQVFKKVYVGLGYDFRYFSLSLFTGLGTVDQLREGFETGAEVSPELKSVPLEGKFKARFGIAVGLPFDIATNWLGKVLGI